MNLQGLESAARSAFVGVLVRAAGGLRRAPIPDWRARPYRILFLRDDGIGDMIVSLEVMRAIVETSPETLTLDVLASPQNAELARGLPWIDDVIVHQRGSAIRSWPLRRALRRRRYDVVIDGRVAVKSVNIQTTLLLLGTRAPWRIGIAGRRNDQVYSVPIDPGKLQHHLEYIAALAAPFGVDASRDWRPRLRLPAADRVAAERRWSECGGNTPRVLVNVTAGHPDRRWPDDRYAALLSRMRERMPRATIAVLAMSHDRRSAYALARQVGGTAVTLSVPETIATVATADLVVTPDTAVSHIASAFERPTLTLLRQGFDRWVPYRTPGRNVFGDDPRYLTGLPADRAVAALDALITDLGPGRGWI